MADEITTADLAEMLKTINQNIKTTFKWLEAQIDLVRSEIDDVKREVETAPAFAGDVHYEIVEKPRK